ncbi:MAG TPA: MFS transporter [Bryobacteraceae bacterium]|jgi:UMF1 family MFS transporter|nr:MFS transporter [Bryobacteraceae bacterium]
MTQYSAKEQRGWYMYDFANSAFSTTVVTLFLGPYLTAIAKSAAAPDGYIHPFGWALDPRSYWSFLVSLSVILQVLFLPIIGAVADYGRRKKEVLAATAYLGASATIGMLFLQGRDFLFGGLLFLVANVAFGASVVIYNSFLPEIAPPEDRDAVSSKGFGIGYIGGGLLLALNLILYLRAGAVGVSEGLAVRISLCSAGVWWAIFTIPTLLALRNRGAARNLPPGERAVEAVLKQLAHTLSDLRRFPQTVTFLIAYLLYNDAIQTVLNLASQFGNDELKIPVSTLTLAILMVQFVAFFGSIAFNRVAAAVNAKRAVILTLVIWTAVLFYIYAAVKTTLEFFVMAAIVAMVMGGSQALSRSLYAQIVPREKEAEYFSIYEISDKGTSWMCPLLFGLAMQYTHSYRIAVLSLIVFFIAGLLVLLKVDIPRGEKDVAAG